MNNFAYQRAADVQDSLEQVTLHPDNKFIAGGTNLIDLLKYNLTSSERLIDINPLRNYHGLSHTEEGGITLGALMTNADTAYHPVVEERYPLLSKAILAGASAQIRNMATNGGNLLQRTRCYYFYDAAAPCNKRVPGSGCAALSGYNRIMAILGTSEQCIAVYPSDMSVALAALDATVQVSGLQAERSIPFSEFHRLPGNTPELDNNLQKGELITGIRLPEKGYQHNYSYLKLRDRNSYAFALVSVATGLTIEDGVVTDARIAMGGVAHKPWRVPAAESSLLGKPVSAENFSAAAEMILEGARGFGDNDFKIELAKRAIIRNGLMAAYPEKYTENEK